LTERGRFARERSAGGCAGKSMAVIGLKMDMAAPYETQSGVSMWVALMEDFRLRILEQPSFVSVDPNVPVMY
jgi:hypothetical protein